ncbi:MAG: hypothetical protein P8R42_29295 [Candidatus Binatia bacterium]|nr:hypothetical protein [Candidatus Binatia bacterium]
MTTSTLRRNYSGPFDPELTLGSFSRQVLAELGREYLLSGHLQDRAGLPLVMMRFGEDAMTAISIDEWMAASPIYSERMQRALRFEGNDVGTVFKNLQFDIGAPHQFMDFQFLLHRPEYGEFWLAHCGALMDVEPFGEERVRTMCHDIEDPTFDATAAAAHPCMKVRPIHRPPRSPEHRMPHCRWRVFIDDEGVAYEQHANLAINRRSKAASVVLTKAVANGEPGGWADYSGTFDPGFQLEDLSHDALVTVLQEIGVQIHLLAHAFNLSIEQRFGTEDADDLSAQQWDGIAALTAERLLTALAIEGDGIESIAKVFQMHPCFQPRAYIDLHVEITGDSSARLTFGPSPAFEETEAHSWFAGLGKAPHPALDAIAGTVNPKAQCVPASPRSGARLAFDVLIDPAADAYEPSQALALAKVSKGATFLFEPRRLPRA